jgi:hypothetical protein
MTITAEEVRRQLSYDPETGIFTWLVKKISVQKGTIAGSLHNNGYLRIKINGKFLSAHRLAWLITTGSFPDDQIDHINGIRNDNRIENLRCATNSQNGANKKSCAVIGFKGVTLNGKRWRARVHYNKKQFNLGTFDTPEEAHEAYCKKATEVHKEFARFK